MFSVEEVKVPPCSSDTKALPAEALTATAFQQGGRGQALGDQGPVVPGSTGRCLHQKWRCWSSCFNTRSGEEAVSPAMAQAGKTFQKLGLII